MTLLEDLEGAAKSCDYLADSLGARGAKQERALAARLRAAAERLRSELAALEIRAKDKRDPLTDHAFCALNAIKRINGGPHDPT